MITGRALSESTVKMQIENGCYATSIRDAIRQFGVNFVAVSPVYESCLKLLAYGSDDQQCTAIKPNCVYVRSPF